MLKQSNWLTISVISFFISVIIAVAFIFYGSNVISSDKAILYYIILIPLGFSAAAFLSKAMRSYSKFKGVYLKYHLELSGPIVIFALVMVGGYYVYKTPPNPPLFDLTVYFDTPSGEVKSLNGKLVYRNNSLQSEAIISMGTASIKQVYKGTTLTLIPDLPGYSIPKRDYAVPDFGTTLHIPLVKDSAFLSRRDTLLNAFMRDSRNYLKDASDFYDVLSTNIEHILNYQEGPFNEFESTVVRYNGSYTKLNADFYTYTTAFVKDFKIEKSIMDALSDRMQAVHRTFFLSYNSTIQEPMYKYLQMPVPDKKLAEQIRERVAEKLRAAQPELNNLRDQVNSLQNQIVSLN